MKRNNCNILCNRIFISIVLMLLMGCGSGSGSSSSQSNLIQTIPININGLNGNNDILVALSPDQSGGYRETIKIYQQDSINPNSLLEVSTVYTGNNTIYHVVSDVNVNNQWVTVTINESPPPFGSPDIGWIALVPLTGSSKYSLAAIYRFDNFTNDRAVSIDNWLLVSSGAGLQLYDISVLSSPVLIQSFVSTSNPTCIIAIQNGFYVITNGGYGYINTSDPLNISYSEMSDLNIKGAKKAFLIGSKMYIGGPSKYAGKCRIARIDISNPLAPHIDYINDTIDGTFCDFSYDAESGIHYLVIPDKVLWYLESGGSIVNVGSTRLTAYTLSYSKSYAWNNRFYFGTPGSGLNTYKMQ